MLYFLASLLFYLYLLLMILLLSCHLKHEIILWDSTYILVLMADFGLYPLKEKNVHYAVYINHYHQIFFLSSFNIDHLRLPCVSFLTKILNIGRFNIISVHDIRNISFEMPQTNLKSIIFCSLWAERFLSRMEAVLLIKISLRKTKKVCPRRKNKNLRLSSLLENKDWNTHCQRKIYKLKTIMSQMSQWFQMEEIQAARIPK